MRGLLKLTLALVVYLGTDELSAQWSPTPPRSADPYLLLSPQELGKSLRVLAEEEIVEGAVLEFTSEGLLIQTEGVERWIESSTADSLWIRRSPQRTGAWIGAGIGVGLTTLSCAETLDECGLTIGLGILTPFFALIGAGIGSTLDPWKLLHP